VIDGKAVVLGVDGNSYFNALHSGRHNEEVQLCAFDVLAMDGDDLRRFHSQSAKPINGWPDDVRFSDIDPRPMARSIPRRMRAGP